MPRRILEVHRTRIEQGIGRECHVFAPLHGISQVDHHGRYVDTVTDDFDVEVGHIEDRLYGTRHLVDTDLVRDLHRIVEVRPECIAMLPSSLDILVIRFGVRQGYDDTTLLDIAAELQRPFYLGCRVPTLDDAHATIHDLGVFLWASRTNELG